ncbi:Na+/H+ antiporter [Parachryseolinea silvisoli]|jgi:Na+/H+ antiporter|uniref:Na+/H+ antiporter n=1 Tax=Parachryseolinea silvisoli TaxID=2873601 RepID=UPI002265EBAF|nr:Na+/H+ antiporter [Parachryseolinea silvisoli]MCD9016514.1 Na+/H+ antiporter [Parachryseolinea silvisoli]
MIHHNLLLILSLLFAVSILSLLSQKLRVSYPIFLVIGGLLISLIPGTPHITLNPELIFLIFLPPLLYEAAWYTSWHDFWKWKRPISQLAFGLVIITSCVVAVISSKMIPGFTLALGFLLGGIISPPDAVAATSVLKGLPVPRRVVTILEGESLVNDASSLIVFRFALAAIISGNFILNDAIGDFFIVAGMGVVVGIAIAHVMYFIHRYMPTTASVDTALTLMTPYIMYIGAERFHFSGVMAVVSGGLFLSFRSHDFLNYRSRMQSTSVWATLVFLMNGFVFILIGLQLPVIMAEMGGYSVSEAIRYGVIISVITIVLRIIWVYPIFYLPRWFSKRIRDRDPAPGLNTVFVMGWAGMRGVVSLASALAIPLTLEGGEAFPQRNLILFITFVVILITLVIQGLTLPLVLRLLKIKEIDEIVPEEEQEAAIRLRLMKVSLHWLDQKHATEVEENELIENIKQQLESDLDLTRQRLETLTHHDPEMREIREYTHILQELVEAQRKELALIRREKLYDHEVVRKQEAQLDLEEAKLNHYTH